ncbi:MAG: gliding motility-associated C-terminal domain-containing protein [Bacteroidia bacterium]|nr:gliding motility-associated C-terminal domain-containing protein [Bacteroidia bacterium]
MIKGFKINQLNPSFPFKHLIFWMLWMGAGFGLQAQNWTWALQASNPAEERSMDISVTPDGYVYTCGAFSGFSFGMTPYGGFGLDGYVAKHDTLGNLIWSFHLGSKGLDDEVKSITATPTGFAITGFFNDSAFFKGTISSPNDTLVSKGAKDFFIAQYDQDGNLLWAKSGGGTGNDEGLGIAPNGNGYSFTGYMTGGVTFGGLGSVALGGGQDMFIASVDPGGTPLWMVRGQSPSADFGKDIAVGPTGNIYVIGNFDGDSLFLSDPLGNPTDTLVNPVPANKEMALISLDINGMHRWGHNAGSNGNDLGRGVAVLGSNVFFTGGISNNATFPGSVTSAGNMGMEIFYSSHDESTGLTNYAGRYLNASNLNSYGEAIALDGAGRMQISGQFAGSVNFGSVSFNSSGTNNAFVASNDAATGNNNWVLKGPSLNSSVATSVDFLHPGKSFATGHFNGNINLKCNVFSPLINDENIWVAQISRGILPRNDSFTVPGKVSQNLPPLANDISQEFLNLTLSSIITPPKHGSASLMLPDTVQYISNSTYSGPDSLEYRVCDGCYCDSAWIYLMVLPPTDPFSRNDTVCAVGNQLNTFYPLLNDTNTSTLDTMYVVISPLHGGATVAGNDSMLYMPNVGFSGQDSLLYTICDNNNICDSAWIYITLIPQADAGSDTSFCATDTINLSGNAAFPGAGEWAILSGTGSLGDSSVNNTSFTTASSGMVDLEWEITYGSCISRDTVKITTLAMPGGIIGNPDTLCPLEITTLQILFSGPGPAWTFWYSDGSSTFSSPSFSSNYSQFVMPGVTTTYTLDSILGNNGCLNTNPNSSVTLVVDSVFPLDIGPDTTLCASDSLVLDAGIFGATYAWSTGSNNKKDTVNTPGTYRVKVTVSNGCVGRDTLVFSNFTGPVVNLGPDTTICDGDVLLLDAGNPGANYAWNLGPPTQTHLVSNSGLNFVTVTDSNGCTGSDTISISVFFGFNVNLGPDTILCAGNSLLLDAGNAGSAFLWSTGQTSQTITVSTQDTFFVQVTNALNCVRYDTILVNISPPPVVFLGNDTALCSGGSLVLDAGNPGSTYLWSTGGTNQTETVFVTGTYDVVVTDANGCMGFDTINVTFNSGLIVSLGNDTSLCAGDSLVLDAGNAGSTYLWSTGGTNQTETVFITGTYDVVVTDANGCMGFDTINVTFNSGLIVSLGNDTSLCGDSLVLDVGNSGSTYLWSTGGTNQTETVFVTGTYDVVVTDANGCSGFDTINVTFNSGLIVSLGNDTSLCAGDSLVLDAGNAGSTYLWSTGGTNQTETVFVTGTYDVVVTDVNGCMGFDTINVTFNSGLIVSLGNDTSLCAGDSLVLDAGNAGSIYLWSTGGVNQMEAIGATGTFNVVVTDVNGCMGFDTINVTFNSGLIVSLGNDTSLCAGDSLVLDAGNAGSTYLWSTGGTNQTETVFITGTYDVVVTDANGCMGFDTINVIFNPNPTVFLGNDTSLCAGDSLVLDAGNSGSTYLWSTGGTNQTETVFITGTYDVVVTDVNGCMGFDTINVIFNPTPIVFLGNDTSLCAGDSLVLDAGNAGSIYLWSTGGTNQLEAIGATGTYDVVVTDANGCSGFDTINVTFNSGLIVSLGNDTSLCAGDSLVLDAGNAGSTYLWSTGGTNQTETVFVTGTYDVVVTDVNGCMGFDTINVTFNSGLIVSLGNDTSLCAGDSLVLDAGNAGSTYLWSTGGTNQTETVFITGTYDVVVTDANGCMGFDTINVIFNPNPTVFLGNDTSLCAGDSLVLDAGNSGSTYLWSTGGTNQTETVFVTGTYDVVVTDANGCMGFDTINVTFNSGLIVSLGNDTSLCAGDSLVLDAGNAGSTYLWSAGGTNQTETVFITGTYDVVVTDANGCMGFDTINVTFNSGLIVSLGNDTSLCAGDSLVLDAGNSGSTYLWSTGGTNQMEILTTSGTIFVTVTDASGCSGSDTLVLSFSAAPSPILIGLDTLYCEQDAPANLLGLPAGGIFSGNGVSNSQFSPAAAGPGGPYPILYSYLDSLSGCPGDTTHFVTVLAAPPAANAGPDQSSGTSLEFHLQGNSPASFSGLWTFAFGQGVISNPTQPNAEVEFAQSGSFQLVWTIDGGQCGLSQDTMEILISGLNIPEGFSPNGDNVNDFFVIRGLEDVSQRHLTVFNRWGNLVFVSENYTNNWQGANQLGDPLTDDTYYYILNLGTAGVFKGYVVIKR